MRDFAELNAALEQERPCVYCSVVETRGSTPQSPRRHAVRRRSQREPRRRLRRRKFASVRSDLWVPARLHCTVSAWMTITVGTTA